GRGRGGGPSGRGPALALPGAPGGAPQRLAPRRGPLGGGRALAERGARPPLRPRRRGGFRPLPEAVRQLRDDEPPRTRREGGRQGGDRECPGPGHGGPLLRFQAERGGIRMSESIRVFVVEDQPQILESLVRILSGAEGLEVCGSARTGEEALETVFEARPQVLLCDLGLPGIDGIEVTRAVRSRAPEVEVLVFTVFDEEERVLDAV